MAISRYVYIYIYISVLGAHVSSSPRASQSIEPALRSTRSTVDMNAAYLSGLPLKSSTGVSSGLGADGFPSVLNINRCRGRLVSIYRLINKKTRNENRYEQRYVLQIAAWSTSGTARSSEATTSHAFNATVYTACYLREQGRLLNSMCGDIYTVFSQSEHLPNMNIF